MADRDFSQNEMTPLVRSALAHLYDRAYLQNHPLAPLFDREGTLDSVTRAQKLRRALLACIEALRPQGQEAAPPEAVRAYAILTYRYVDGLSIEDIGAKLALSRRQTYREHEKGVEAVASLFAAEQCREGRLPVAQAEPDRLQVAQAEVDRLQQAVHAEPLNPEDVVQGVIGLLSPLARQAGIQIRIERELAASSPIVADRIILRQALLNLFSYALGHGAPGDLAVAFRYSKSELYIELSEHTVEIEDRPHAAPVGERPDVGLIVARSLIAAQGGRLEVQAFQGCWQAHIMLPLSRRRTLLVIDDNTDIVALLQRYLAGHEVAVVGATEGKQALRLARELQPQLITLDVMMPSQDGWETLQKLKADPETQNIPVVVCSVLNEPRLAQNMGASDYITKPVRQDDLLPVLRRWLGPLTTP